MPKNIFNKKSKLKSRDGFRYRGLERSRLENLTDTIFGFSITLLVIASEVPKTYLELQSSMYSFIGFIFCIMLLLGIWNNHSSFFQHYGLEDNFIKVLNSLFLFVLLFYVYPLKYLFSYIGTAIYIRFKLSFGDSSEALKLTLKNLSQSNLDSSQWADIMIRFGLGLFFIYLVLMLFHVHASRKKKELKLNKTEIFITKTFIQKYAILIVVTIVSMAIVLIFGGQNSHIAGLTYLSIPVVLPIHELLRKRKLSKGSNKKPKKLKEALDNSSSTSETTETIDEGTITKA